MLIKGVSFEDVSQRLFQYSLLDHQLVRSRYFKMTNLTAVASVSKQHMVEALVREELGNNIVDKYLNDSKRQIEIDREETELWMDERE